MSLTLAILSWNSHTTLINTLDSYYYRGLLKLADQKVIFFQEISAEDSRIAREYGFDAIGSPNNIGIGAAYKQLVDFTTSDLFLFLENDWLLIEEPTDQITDAKVLVGMAKVADVAKFRHRRNPGMPLWSSQYALVEREHPEFMLDALHWRVDEEMDELAPEIVRWTGLTGGPRYWYKTESQYANWTNNPTMFRTEWLRQNIVPRLTGDIERAIQPWWATQSFRVIQSDGLFTHMRLDR